MLRNGKETRNPIDTSWKAHLFRSALNQAAIGFDLLRRWRHSSPSLCAGPNAGTFLHSVGQPGLPHCPGVRASSLGHGCSPSAALSCETQIFCELKQSPRRALTPHRVSLRCSGLFSFPSGLPQHSCLQLSLLNIQECCRFSCRTTATGHPLPAAWDKTYIPLYGESRIATAWWAAK